MKKLLLFSMSLAVAMVQANAILHNVKRLLPQNPVIVEAGAYNGDDTVIMAQTWPHGTVHAFEPVPYLLDKVRSKTDGLRNVCVHPYALSNTIGPATMYVSTFSNDEMGASSSLLEPDKHLSIYPDISFNNCITVQTITLDEWAQQNNITEVSFLWLDMQGTELAMLKASPRILKTVKVIFMEVAFVQTYKNMPLFPEVLGWLEDQGFTALLVKTSGPLKAEGNVLFVRTHSID